MEQDPELKGQGNSYTTEFRQYDPRLGRWLSLDPLAAKYPSMSPYVAFNNNPICFTDPLGLEGTPATEVDQGQEVGVKTTDNISFNTNSAPSISNQKYQTIEAATRVCDYGGPAWSIGRKTDRENLWLNVRGQHSYSDIDKFSKEPYEDGSFLVVFGESIQEASKRAQNYFGDKKPQTTVLNVHGTVRDTYNEEGQVIQSDVHINNRPGYEISKFNIDDYLSNSSRLNPIKRGEIQGMVDLMNFTQTNFVLLACKAGSIEPLVKRLMSLYNQSVVNSGLQFYVNADETTLKTRQGHVNMANTPLTKTVSSGWVLINIEGRMFIKTSDGKTGNLIIDSNGEPALYEEKTAD